MSTYNAAEPETIRTLFDRIACRYDLGNAICSLGFFRRWNRALVEGTLGEIRGGSMLDLCCGTGDIASLALKKSAEIEEAYLLDFSPGMLSVAQEKFQGERRALHFLQADAQQIPLPSESIDLATQSYGIRNVQDPRRCMEEVWRVLRPGGCWGILELTSPTSPLIAPLYRIYLRLVLPLVGKVVSGDFDAYSYLSRSICNFMSPEALTAQLEQVGFKQVKQRPLFCGAAHLWVVRKE